MSADVIRNLIKSKLKSLFLYQIGVNGTVWVTDGLSFAEMGSPGRLLVPYAELGIDSS